MAGDEPLRARLAKNGRALVEDRFSLTRMIDGYVDLYRTLGQEG
jgi:hypothetical protein